MAIDFFHALGILNSMKKEELIFSDRKLWSLVWPLFVEQLLQISVGMADIVIVSRVGEAALSGASLVDQINVLVVQLFAALGTGGAVVCSHYVGARNRKMASESARQLVYAVVSVSLVLLAGGLLFYRPLLSAIFGKIESDVMENSCVYFLITWYSLPGIALYNAASSIFRAEGNSKVSMIVAVAANILNVAGNIVMVCFLKFGIEGCAWPTMVSRNLSALVLFACLLRSGRDRNSPLSMEGIEKIRFDFSIIVRIMKIGIPNALENSAFQMGKILVLSLVATYGTSAIAANAAANSVAGFEILPGASIGLAMLTVIGQCLGAGKPEQAVHYTKKLMIFCFAGMWLVNVPLALFMSRVMRMYSVSDLTLRLACGMALVHGLCSLFIWPFSFTLPNVLRASGDSAFTMVVSVVSMWTVRVGFSWLFKFTGFFGITDALGLEREFVAVSVWVAMILDWIVRSSFFITRFAGGKWKSQKVV